MVKKLQKSDFLFLLALFGGLLIYLLSIYTPDHFADETFYPSIPLRLINGDSFVLDEWHLTQFSTIFLYFPVRIWLAFTGSTDGILLFLRFFYLTIHTCTAIGLYAFFRKHNIWAIAAALLFYTQVPLRFLTANYHSLLALFLLLFTITLVILCKKRNLFLYLLSGFFFGCCCICNPFDAILYAVYIIACLFQQKKKEGSYQYFFSPQAILKFSAGIAIAAILLIIVFFVTGGTLSGFIQNFPNLLTDTGHNIFVSPLEAFLEKIEITWWHFSQISFGLPFLLPLFYLVLWFDKKIRR